MDITEIRYRDLHFYPSSFLKENDLAASAI
jgi:hypothetical protein